MATIINDDDVASYKQAWDEQDLPYGATLSFGLSIIGLNDIETEGDFKWDDGTVKCMTHSFIDCSVDEYKIFVCI